MSLSQNSLSQRRFGVELEIILPLCPSKLPRGATPYDKVAAHLRQHGIVAKTEAEIAAAPRANHANVWVVKKDDSLGLDFDNFEGVEITSPILSGERDLQQLLHITRLLNNTGFTTNFQTGLHVHHEADDLDLSGWRRLMLNYYLTEPAFDRLVVPYRRGNENRHARSNRQDIDFAGLVEQLEEAETIADISNQLFGTAQSTRDMKLNVDAFVKHGTVEFRQHEGTLNEETIEHWVRLTQSFVDHAADKPELIAVNDGITDPIEAWEEVEDDSPRAQDPLLKRLISIAGPKTRDHFIGVIERHERAVPPLIANAGMFRQRMPQPGGWS